MKTLHSSLLAGCLILSSNAFAAVEVAEPAGSLPVLNEVDVVVVGGGSGGVAAAVEAARRGAKVFLAAPRPYLGEDICATYRLWLEPGEKATTDLAREVFQPSRNTAGPAIGEGLPFEYSPDRSAARQHRDTDPPSLLKDRKWRSAAKESVQFDGDVTLLLDLGESRVLGRIHALAYQRPGDFEVGRVEVSVSTDRENWTPAATLTNELAGLKSEDVALPFSAPLKVEARYLKLEVRKAEEAKRVLLAEIVVEAEGNSSESVERKAAIQPATPMQVKRVFDQAMIDAGAKFLFWSYATDLLRDEKGKPAGVVIESRSGRQAIVAKVVIDATERGNLARQTSARFAPYPAETLSFNRTVVGGAPSGNAAAVPRERKTPVTIIDRKGDAFPVHEYRLEAPMPDGSFASFAALEQAARDWTWTPEAVDASEVLFQVPPDSFRGRASLKGAWPGAGEVPLGCFQPAGTERLFVLNGCADVSREAATKLTRPVNLMAVGARVGEAAAGLAARLPAPRGVHLAGDKPDKPVAGEIRGAHAASDLRVGQRVAPAGLRGVPVLGEYDVVVVGGGTGGAPAAIGAGRRGAKTLLIEYLHGLGGVGTMGFISSYYHGNKVGFTTELDGHVAALGEPDKRTSGKGWSPEHKSEAYRRELRKAGVDVWYGCLGTGAVVEGDRVKGVVVLTPHGRGAVLAGAVVDSTGNADIAAAAGATCRYTDDTEVAVQGTGLPPKELGQKYTNTDYTFVDDNDVFDIWRALVVVRQKYRKSYDHGQLIDTRERRQIVGDFTLSPMDMIMRRTQPDTVVIARSNFDTHGYIIHPMFMLRPPDRADVDVRVPYRCLLPRGLDGILVTGLGVSAHRDALPCIRMQADVQNQGYAAGVAAAMIAERGCATRELDIKALQKHLVEIGNLPESALTEEDSFPLPRARVAEAVAALANEFDQLEVVLAQFETARPLLREALASARDDSVRLTYAHVLGMMGDAAGAAALAAPVSAADWDEGWEFKGMGQYGASMSPLDSRIVALGRTRSPLALKPILEKAARLGSDSEFSHFRATALALETIGDLSAARTLAAVLQMEGVGGHAVAAIGDALEDIPSSGTDNKTRGDALRELCLARALYRCGDHQGVGERILRQYARDLHGHYARHAQAVLKGGGNQDCFAGGAAIPTGTRARRWNGEGGGAIGPQ